MYEKPAVLFYDAQCSLCEAWKQWLEGRVEGDRLRFVDANDKALARELGIGDVEQLDRRMCLLRPDGQTRWGYDALVGLLEERSDTAGLAWLMGLAPFRLIGRRVYDQVARRRKCAARQEEQAIHTPA